MVDVKTRMSGAQDRKAGEPPPGTPGAPIANNPRFERLAAIARASQPPMVSVEPTKNKYRKTLKHLPSKIGFRETGPAVWPLDRFTQRRLREGSIRVLGRVTRPVRVQVSPPKVTATEQSTS